MILPFANSLDSQYFGKYGPIDDQVAHNYIPLSSIVFQGSGLTLPKIIMSIPDKVLSSSENLIVEVSTNIDFDTSDNYLLQI